MLSNGSTRTDLVQSEDGYLSRWSLLLVYGERNGSVSTLQALVCVCVGMRGSYVVAGTQA